MSPLPQQVLSELHAFRVLTLTGLRTWHADFARSEQISHRRWQKVQRLGRPMSCQTASTETLLRVILMLPWLRSPCSRLCSRRKRHCKARTRS